MNIMGVIALAIGGVALLIALGGMAIRCFSIGSSHKVYDGALADGGDKQKQSFLLDAAEDLGLDVEEYETWWDLERAIEDEAAEAAREA